MEADINSFSYSRQEIRLDRIILLKPIINLESDSTGMLNLQFIIDALKSKEPDTAKSKLSVSCNSFQTQNARFKIKKYGIAFTKGVFNPGDIAAGNVNIAISKLFFAGDTVACEISTFSFIEKCGFRITEFSSDFKYSPGHFELKKLKLITPYTNIDAPLLDLVSENNSGFSDLINKVKTNTVFDFSKVGLKDFAYFSSGLAGLDQTIMISGNITGTVSDLKCRKLDIEFGKRTVIAGNINISGLPDIKHTFINATLNSLITNSEDIENFHLPASTGSTLKLPDVLKKFGTITYNGTFLGYINDFEASGTLDSELGSITSDLAMKQETDSKQLNLTGNIGTSNFDIGKLLDNDLLGKYTMNAEIQAAKSNDNHITAKLNGKIDNAGFNKCEIHNIDIKGDLVDKRFDGFIFIKDKNLNLDFSGGFDFTSEIPQFDFTAYVSEANLGRLNIIKEGDRIISFILQTRFSGSNIDNLNGNIDLSEIDIKSKNKSLLISNISVESAPSPVKNKLTLKSDMLDAEISGRYNLQSVFSAVKNTFFHYFPLLADSVKYDPATINDFDFNIRFGKSHDFCEMFLPTLDISEGTIFKGSFNATSNLFKAEINSEKITYGNKEFKGLSLNINTANDSLKINADSKSVLLGKSIGLEGFGIQSNSHNNSSLLAIKWSGRDSERFRGKLNAFLTVQKNTSGTDNEIIVKALPSQIIINDSIWQLAGSKIVLRKAQVDVNDFVLLKDNQYIKIAGKISERQTDTLRLDFNHISLSNFSMLLNTKGIKFKGELNGKAQLINLFKKPLIYSDIEIQNFEINEQLLGHTVINSNWNQERKMLHLNLFTTRDEIKPLNISGDFSPDTKKIDFAVKFDKFRLKFFQPFLKNILSDMNGMISETINVFGTLDKPLVYGKLNLQKASFIINYLKTKYNFSDYIEITNNAISFDNIHINDVKGNYSILKGSINHKYFKEITLNLIINSDNFQCLNTRETDNSLYYGTANATGITTITGKTNNIHINVSAKTGSGTRFFIPLSSSNEIIENNFIRFINHDSVEIINTDVNQVNLSGIRLSFDLEVTPDAEIQLILNSKAGDIIKARGNSNLRMEINTQGDFNIYGEYSIDEGDYTFTLENFLSKKFQIEKGGSLSWNGDPYNADVNISALYTLNASLDGFYLDTSEVYRQRLPVICRIDMTGKLMSPVIAFSIDIPDADEKDRAQLKSLSQDELNKQFLSLLLIGRFQPLSFLGSTAPTNIGSASNISESASEFLSNQLSHWISQISNDFDIGFNYRPGDQLTKDEVEVALKTQLFNDRLSINGKVSTGGQYSQTNNMVGDFEMDYKLNKNGKFRIKAYNNSNDNIYKYDLGPYTQGVGIFYREEFNNFEDLIRKYLHRDKNKKQ